jgi:transcriptional/translational regulatory protein YebC/TACO1
MEVLADPAELDTVRAVLTHQGFAPETAEVTQRAATGLALSGEPAERMVRLLEALQGLEEVRDVYSNVEIPDEALGGL